MNKKRNISYIKPEDPEFLKVLKRQAGYDDKNHKFDELQNAAEDFVENEDSEQPQVVVLKEGDLTAEQAETEKKRIEKEESEAKADLTQKIIFQSKSKITDPVKNKRKLRNPRSTSSREKKTRQLLSFGDDEQEED